MIGRMAKSDESVRELAFHLREAKLSQMAQKIYKKLQKTGAAYGVDSLADAIKAPVKKVLMALKELESEDLAMQDKKTKVWFAEE